MEAATLLVWNASWVTSSSTQTRTPILSRVTGKVKVRTEIGRMIGQGDVHNIPSIIVTTIVIMRSQVRILIHNVTCART